MTRLLGTVALALVTFSASAQDQPSTPSPNDKAKNIGEWCWTIGSGAGGMAQRRDQGMKKPDVIGELLKGRDVSEKLRGAIQTMADVAYRYPSLSPGSVKMLAYGICVGGQLQILDVPMLKQMENVVASCNTSTSDTAAFDQCADKGFLDLITAKMPKTK